nr:hypothetical protein [Streptacidiphilus pinicola]
MESFRAVFGTTPSQHRSSPTR